MALEWGAEMEFTPTPAEELAQDLGVSAHAVQFARDADFIDLHLDSFIPARLFRYDLGRDHGPPRGRGRFFGHLDFPRALDAGLTGALWSITTNPFRTRAGRWRVLLANLERLQSTIAATEGRLRIVKSSGEYRKARSEGAHGAFIAIQGGNALDAREGYAQGIPDDVIIAVTLIHLTPSFLGRSSVPLPFGGPGLTREGVELVRSLNARRVFVDLAHIHAEGFWETVRVHDASQPLIDSHTGLRGVTPHWRNLDDAQLKAIADTGGVVGIIFDTGFLRHAGAANDAGMIVDHIDHAIRVVGEDFVALGSDYDGAITPPPDLRDGRALARLIQRMLDRGYSDARLVKILGGNFLRALEQLRP